MKNILLVSAFLFSGSAFADVSCSTPQGWSIQFISGDQPTFFDAYQVLNDGSKSEADVTLQQSYSDVNEFKARVVLDGQNLNIKTNLSKRDGEYAVYTGTVTVDGTASTMTCKQN